MNGREIRVAELFAGIGGFRLGLERASPRYKIVWANDWIHGSQEWDAEKKKWKGSKNLSGQIYTKHWNDGTYHDQDIHTVNPDDIPDIDAVVAGFPCQPFSLAGPRGGFADFRGTLFFEIARIAERKRPKVLLLENVRGLLSAQNGFCFWAILSRLDELGYDVEWKVLNTKNWLPQTRERVFIIAHLREAGRCQVYPFSSYDEADNGEGEVIGTLTGGAHSGGLHSDMTALVVADRTRSYAGLGRNFESPKPFANTLTGVQKDNLLILANTIRSGGRGSLDRHSWDIVVQDEIARRFTEIEEERLQGFPDDWTKGICQTQRYHCLGNAVSVPVIEYLGKLLLEACIV